MLHNGGVADLFVLKLLSLDEKGLAEFSRNNMSNGTILTFDASRGIQAEFEVGDFTIVPFNTSTNKVKCD